MTTITLDTIKAEHARLAELIASFEKQQAVPVLSFPETTISLEPGEEYAGQIIGKDSEPSYHLILRPGEISGKSWQESTAWAKDNGGELPTRREQSLLFANCQEHFEKDWYWSCETHKENDAYAWCQYFDDGDQNDNRKDVNDCRARAVRRFPI